MAIMGFGGAPHVARGGPLPLGVKMNLHAVPSSWLLINQTLEDQCLNNWASIGRVVFPAHREQGPDAQKPVFLRSRTASADGWSQSFQPLLRGGGERIQKVPQRFVAKTYSWELSFDLSRAFSASLWGQTPSTPCPPPHLLDQLLTHCSVRLTASLQLAGPWAISLDSTAVQYHCF